MAQPSQVQSSRVSTRQRLVRELSTPEQFLISALRLWGQGRSDQGLCCCRSLLRNGFHAAGLPVTEFEAFDRVLTLINAATKNGLLLEMPTEPTLSRTEERYLRALAFAQSGDAMQVKWTLGVWLPLGAVRLVTPELVHFARACATAGLILTPAGGDDAPNATTSRVIPLRSLSAQLH
jgi:hypothetical protein